MKLVKEKTYRFEGIAGFSGDGGSMTASYLEAEGPGDGMTLRFRNDGETEAVHLDADELRSVQDVIERSFPRARSEGPHVSFVAGAVAFRVGYDNMGEPYRQGISFILGGSCGLFVEEGEAKRFSRLLAKLYPEPAPAMGR